MGLYIFAIVYSKIETYGSFQLIVGFTTYSRRRKLFIKAIQEIHAAGRDAGTLRAYRQVADFQCKANTTVPG